MIQEELEQVSEYGWNDLKVGDTVTMKNGKNAKVIKLGGKGKGFPRNFVPSYSWGGAASFSTYQLKKVIEVARVVMKRRDIFLSKVDENILQHVFDETSKFRNY